MNLDRRSSRLFTFSPTHALWALTVATCVVMASSTLWARDRPGTPNNERAWQCNRPLSQPPAVCVEFNNTASEDVQFDIEFTVDGVKVVDLRPHATDIPKGSRTASRNCIGCQPFLNFPEHSGEAVQNFNGLHALAKGRTGSDSGRGYPLPPQGLMIPKLEYGSTYCFRFKARRESDDVVSEQWSNWACANTDAAPPPRPSAPDHVTADYTAGGKDWRIKPPTVVVKWGSSANAAEYGVSGGQLKSRTVQPEAVHEVVDTLQEADVAENERSPSITYRVCAKNITGETCATASTYVPLGDTVGRGSIPAKDFALAPTPRIESRGNVPVGGLTMPTGPASSDRLTQRAATSDPVAAGPGAIAHDFTGVWATVTAAGNHYTMNLTQQNGDRVSGTYARADGSVTGTIDGRIEGGVLVYRWTEGSSKGSGKFALAADGRSFQGSWSYGDDPNLGQNSWTGTRK